MAVQWGRKTRRNQRITQEMDGDGQERQEMGQRNTGKVLIN